MSRTMRLAYRNAAAFSLVCISSLLLLACQACAPASSTAASTSLEAGFRNPPNEAMMRVYWWWLNSNVTKESITEDLEQMHKQGVGGALLFDSDNETHRKNALVRQGPKFGTPEYRELFAHALKEADRLGIEISLLIQSGWDLGGPSVQLDDAAKLVVWSEVEVAGAKTVDVKLPLPKLKDDYYRDIAVLAYRKRAVSADAAAVVVTSSSNEPGRDAPFAADGDLLTYWCSSGTKPGDGPTRDRPEWIELRFEQPITASSFVLHSRKGYGPKKCGLQVAESDGQFRTIQEFDVRSRGTATIEFDPVTGNAFRLMMYDAYDAGMPDTPRHVALQDMTLQGEKESWPSKPTSPAPIQNLAMKTASRETGGSMPDSTPLLTDVPAQSGEAVANEADIVDLTSMMDADGRLIWDAPSGAWHVLRFGYTYSGAKVKNGSAAWGGRVLDHLQAEAIKNYWRDTVVPFIEDPAIAPYVGKSWKYVHSDSWEMGGMNWSQSFRDEFRKRRGYDPLKYLPVIAGHIVDSRDVSNRFLNDYRRTIADCIAQNHYKTFTDIAHQHNLLTHAEAGGPHGAPVDALESLGQCDVSMMEFWAKSPSHRVKEYDRFFVKQAASAAHIYDKKIVAAEGETTIGTHWEESFRDNLKPTFDRAICEGLNRLVFHQFTASPKSEGLPGQEYFAGTHFSPRVTWWPLVHGWLNYVNRCQYMALQGQFVADVCYYNGDNIPNMVPMKDFDAAGVLPEYDYDVINQDILLNRLTAHHGSLVLPNGMSYRVLVLPRHQFISLEALRKIEQLVAAGATVVGPRPTALTGLREYPKCDLELKELTDKLWGDSDGKKITEHIYGNGKVLWIDSAKEALKLAGVLSDFASGGVGEMQLDYIHRRDGNADIYFVSNRTDRAGYRDCTFRVSDKAPELWDAFTGDIHKLLLYRATDDGRMSVPIYFEPYGSAIVVFRSKTGPHFVSLAKDGQSIFPQAASNDLPPVLVAADGDRHFTLQTDSPGKYELSDNNGKKQTVTVAAATSQPIEGTWTVRFAPGWGAPETTTFDKLQSWTDSEDPDTKHFSGIATYEKEFDLPPEMLADGRRVELDLGDLAEMAEVSLNGKTLGAFWKPPFVIDISEVAKPGKNTLEVRVANHWRNRLIGDAALPEDQRRTKTNIVKYNTGKHDLLRSGLFGPVIVRSNAIERHENTAE